MNKGNNKLNSTKRNIYFFFVRQFIALKNLFFRRRKNIFLFILSPPFSGSTLLNQILSTSSNISCNNNIGLREGQHLPIACKIMFHDDRWDIQKQFPWQTIKRIWIKYWDLSKAVLLEKSPPNIIRAISIQKHFTDCKFICLVRNPYAQIEGKIRRHEKGVTEATGEILFYLKTQQKNIEQLKSVLYLSYEELTNHPEVAKERIIEFIPKLSDISITQEYKAHNFKTSSKMGIVNLNKEKIDKLTDDQITIINSIFEKEKEVLEYFGYHIVKR